MNSNENFNHPQKGSQIKVNPIKKKKDIQLIKSMLQDNKRDLCLFVLGINTNLRASDLTAIKVGDVKNIETSGQVEIKEIKTQKYRFVTFNQSCVNAINNHLKENDLSDDDYLFKSQRAPKLSVPSVNRLIKGWCKAIRLKGNYGSHTLRKTFAYHAYQSGTSLPLLMECLNHSSQKQTLIYIGIEQKEVKNVFMSNEL
jgi:integrase